MADTCEKCGFDWRISAPEAIDLVSDAPATLSTLFSGGFGAPSDDPEHWSATGYLWHLVDVLRFGTDRLWTITLDPSAGVPGWDQEQMAANRNYEKLSPVVGLKALKAAAHGWVAAARDAPLDGKVEHPSLGTLTTFDSIRRNAHEVQHHAADVRQELGPTAG